MEPSVLVTTPRTEPMGEAPNGSAIGPWAEWGRLVVTELRRQAQAQERLLERFMTQQEVTDRDQSRTDAAAAGTRADIANLQQNQGRAIALVEKKLLALGTGIIAIVVAIVTAVTQWLLRT